MASVNVNFPFVSVPTKDQLFNSAKLGVQKKMEEVNKYSNQIHTQNKYETFLDLSQAGLLRHHTELYKKIGQNAVCQPQNQMIYETLENTHTQLEFIMSQVEEAQSELAQINTPAGMSMNVRQLMIGKLENMKASLNGRFAGKAIFGGFDTDKDPVGDIVGKHNLDAKDKPTDNYAQHSQEKISYVINNTREIKYNVVASDKAFVNIIGGYHLALQGKYKEAQEHLQEGHKLLNQLITEVGNNARTLNEANNILKQERISLNDEFTSIFNANQEETAILLTNTIHSLMYSQWAVSQIKNISLISMLKD